MARKKYRVAVFGSFYRGYYVLSELLHGSISDIVSVVGVASDDPDSSWVNAGRRVWQYPHTQYEKVMVTNLAQTNGLDIFRGRVNDAAFYERIESQWQPQICIMATFGQRIGRRLIDLPPLGFYNLHPCFDDKWPSHYVGGNPFEALMRDGRRYTRVVMHGIDEGFDTGPLVAISDSIAIPEQCSVTDMHKITAYAAARLASRELQRIVAANQRAYD